MSQPITVSVTINAPLQRVWDLWTAPEHIVKWCFASDDWEAPRAENDLRVGGRFTTRMQAKDGSAGFDFGGTYTEVEPHAAIAYEMGDDGRKVRVVFAEEGGRTTVTESFDPENENPAEMQRAGWQAILENFRTHAESV
jgi:uncharacterized protein YndB with AHSA1/START domain